MDYINMTPFIMNLFISILVISFIFSITKSIYGDIDEINNSKDDIEVEILSLEIINDWFIKNDDFKKENQAIVYALIIEDKNNKKVLLQSFFDTNTRKLVKDRSITYLELDNTLTKMFNGKDYLFFE